MIKKIVRVILLLVLAVVAYLLFFPVAITPGTWEPPVAPTLTGQYQQNNRLAEVQRLSIGDGHSPEDVAVDSQGRIYAGLDDGRIIQLQPDGTHAKEFAGGDDAWPEGGAMSWPHTQLSSPGLSGRSIPECLR